MTTTLGFLETSYLMGPYLGGYVYNTLGSQVEMKLYRNPDTGSQVLQNLYKTFETGSQADQKISDDLTIGNQVEQLIYDNVPIGSQVLQNLYKTFNTGSQIDQKIYDDLITGSQDEGKIYKEVICGQQVLIFINRTDDSEITGSQVTMKIYSDLFIPGQIEQKIYSPLPMGQQVKLIKEAVYDILCNQVDQKIYDSLTIGNQINQKIYDLLNTDSQINQKIYEEKITGSQVDQKLYHPLTCGLEVRFAPLMHLVWERYLTNPYLTDNYLAAGFHALQRSQVEQKLYHPKVTGSQVFQNVYEADLRGKQVSQKIYDDQKLGQQTEQKLYHPLNLGSQVYQIIYEAIGEGAQALQKLYHPRQLGSQVNQKLYNIFEQDSQVNQIIEDVFSTGSQVKLKIYDEKNTGSQVMQIKSVKTGNQVQLVIYNVTQLRILQDFVSRGTPALGGLNWTSNVALKVGDFSTVNLNTDVLEQRCQTLALPPLWILTCDTGIPQGAFIDTLAILGHNLTKSARVEVQGSTDPLFGSVGFSVVLNSELVNTYWISPALPNEGFRYWRLIIDDLTNSSGSLYIGAIIFGSAAIMSVAETFENPIQYGLTHFKDSVETEGFRSVSNDRALRKQLTLNFSNLRYDSGNYALLKEYWLNAKTDIACLIIPRPTKASAFAVFSKLTQLAKEEHNAISDYDHYVSFTLDWDESL
jgi:nitrogen regulatory protein PII